MRPQLVALVVVAAVVLIAAATETLRARRARRRLVRQPNPASLPISGAPYVLYFSGPGCTTCRTHQEPALARLQGVRIEKVDAFERSDLARLYHVYTLPTTVVMSKEGVPLHVNYGYAPAGKLRRQLEELTAEAS